MREDRTEERWRVGRRVPRNIYRDDEPIAMLATPEIAAEIVDGMNEVTRLRAERKVTSELDEEMAFYEAHRAELVASSNGKYVLVKGSALVGIFDTLDEAMVEGYRRFRGTAFLARRIAEVDEVASIPTIWTSDGR